MIKFFKQTTSVLLVFLMLFGTAAAFAEDTPQYGYCNTDTTIFMGASSKALADGTADKGTRVIVLNELPDDTDNTTWYNVQIDGDTKTGYIKSADVDLVTTKKPLMKHEEKTSSASSVVINDVNAYPVLQASGIVDPMQLPGAKSAEEYQDIAIGEQGDTVKSIKQRLLALGYINSVGNNKLSKEIKKYIKEFQTKNGLDPDGECSAEFQAKLFSETAKMKDGTYANNQNTLVISKASVKTNKNGGGTISFQIKNTGKDKIDAFDFNIKLYNAYGERFTLHGISSDVSLREELNSFSGSEERHTLKKGASYTFVMDMGKLYFAGCKIAITGYHTSDGNTVRYNDDELNWYGIGKGVEKGYQEPVITPLTEAERAVSGSEIYGTNGEYVDSELAEIFMTESGMLITSIEKGGEFDKAGLCAGDILLAVGDVRIFGLGSLNRAALAAQDVNSVQIIFWRNGKLYATRIVHQLDKQDTAEGVSL